MRTSSVCSTLLAAALRASAVVATCFALPAAGADPGNAWQVPGGHAERGPMLVRTYGCAMCHSIPRVAHAVGNVGPPLAGIGDRRFIAGMLTNTPDNLMRWIRNPQAVVPGNAMPDTGVTAQDAQDIAAFLYTLRDPAER